MHAVLFSIKRVFHKSVWFCRRLLTDYCLTPSRFDILHMLHRRGDIGAMWQSEIREVLGVAGPTVSRMIKALVALGFVRSERSSVDRRQCNISLTARGRETIAHAIGMIIDSGIITNVVVHFLCAKWECPVATFEAVDRLDTTLRYMREQLLDEATMFYPWHPDDWHDLLIFPKRPFVAPGLASPPP